jgi:diguanylate cyclase
MIENTYPESVEESGNYLRMTLKNISKSKLPYNPISYLLWYEYATGRNDELVKDIELLLESETPITATIIAQLFKKHIADNKALHAARKTREFQKILTEMTKHLTESGIEMDAQGNNINTYATELNQATSLDTIIEIAKHIVAETKIMADSRKALTNKLDSTISEIDVLRKELEGTKQAAKTDMLTGLLNRRGFDETIVQVIENLKTTHEPLCIIMLDIDFFKKVNDAYGHLIGDTVLKMLSGLIKDSIKGKDIAARFGGEEFILALPQTPIKGAHALAEQIRLNLKRMNLKIKGTGESISQITISLGIALYRDGESIESVIKRADEALYQAKDTGRDKTVSECD